MTATDRSVTAHRRAVAPPDRTITAPGETVPVPALSLDRGGVEPLHRQLERAFTECIVTGRWPARGKLPPEPALAAALGVNRGTLRRALAALIARGSLLPIRGRGTFVAASVLEPSIAQRFRSLSEDFAAQGFAVRTEVRSAEIGRLPLTVRTLLGAGASSPGLRLERVFHGTAGALAYLVNYVRAERCPGIETVDFTAESLFGTLSGRYGIPIVRGRRSFSAQRATREVAGALDLAAGDPVLYLEQVTYTTGSAPIEYSDVWIDSSRVAITSILERERHG